MRLLVRLSLGFALSRDRAQRWRQVSIVAAAFVVTLLALGSVGLVVFAQGAEDRRAARMPVLASDSEPYGLTMSLRGEIWQDRQFPVVWLGEGQPGVPPVLPPGMDRLPDPETVVVSPGLVESGAVEGLGLVRSSAGTGPGGTIGSEGLGAPSEWLAYARPPLGRCLGEGGALAQVVGFGPGPGDLTLDFETQSPTPSVRAVWFVAGWLFLLPAAILAAGAAAALSPLRSRRLRTLYRLGFTAGALRALAAVETVALAVVGVAAAVAVWVPGATHVAHLPLAGLTLPPGGLGISAGLVAIAVAAVLVAFAALGFLGARISEAVATSPSDRGVPTAVSRWRLASVTVGVLLLVVGRLLGGRGLGAALIWCALLVLLGGLPWAMPWLVHALGLFLTSLRHPARWLAGQRLRFSPAALARPAVAIGALVFVAGALTGIYQRLSITSDATSPPARIFILNWRDAQPGDYQLLSDVLPGAAVVPVREGPDGASQAFLPD